MPRLLVVPADIGAQTSREGFRVQVLGSACCSLSGALCSLSQAVPQYSWLMWSSAAEPGSGRHRLQQLTCGHHCRGGNSG